MKALDTYFRDVLGDYIAQDHPIFSLLSKAIPIASAGGKIILLQTLLRGATDHPARQSLDPDVKDSQLRGVADYIERNYQGDLKGLYVVALEWEACQAYRTHVETTLWRDGGHSYVIGSFDALRSGAIEDETFANPIIIVGQRQAPQPADPLRDPIFVIASLFDDTAYVLFPDATCFNAWYDVE